MRQAKLGIEERGRLMDERGSEESELIIKWFATLKQNLSFKSNDEQ